MKPVVGPPPPLPGTAPPGAACRRERTADLDRRGLYDGHSHGDADADVYADRHRDADADLDGN